MHEEYIGKKVKVVVEDFQKVSVKYGKLLRSNEFFIVIKEETVETMIPRERIVRVEVDVDGGK